MTTKTLGAYIFNSLTFIGGIILLSYGTNWKIGVGIGLLFGYIRGTLKDLA